MAKLPFFSACILAVVCASPALANLGAMPEGAATSAPPGFVSFCMHEPAQCRDDRGAGSGLLHLDAKAGALIASVNNSVNQSTTWVADSVTDGRQEHFKLVKNGIGDCEDIAVTKRAMLHRAGIPLHNLRLAIGKNMRGELHAVLLVLTDAGDLVLDSPDFEIRNWRRARLTWLERQDGTAMGWQTIPRAG